jgi:hypothetical protein
MRSVTVSQHVSCEASWFVAGEIPACSFIVVYNLSTQVRSAGISQVYALIFQAWHKRNMEHSGHRWYVCMYMLGFLHIWPIACVT